MRILRTFFTAALVCGAIPSAPSDQSGVSPSGLQMSPALLELLRAEMRELITASQAISVALPTGDWAQIEATSEQMRESYILKKKLTEAQKKELGSLPEPFKQLDEQFHLKAEKLAHAASAHDAELTAFYFARLLEGCAECHAAYAQQRFPGLAVQSEDSRHHH